jgi:hypothetical protein
MDSKTILKTVEIETLVVVIDAKMAALELQLYSLVDAHS